MVQIDNPGHELESTEPSGVIKTLQDPTSLPVTVTQRVSRFHYFYLGFAPLYGFFFVNYIDLIAVAQNPLADFRPWLLGLYFAPFVPVLLDRKVGFFLGLGILVSLMNDLFYYPSAYVMRFGDKVNLLQWWAQQLGFEGSKLIFVFHVGSVAFPVTSLIMGESIYIRIAACALLFWFGRPDKPSIVAHVRTL